MPTASINGLSLAYEVIGDMGQPWVITPGGRFTKESPGVRELAVALAEEGNRVLIWDRPNCGASDVSFEGSSESAMQADTLAGLLTHLDMTPAVIAGGSGGPACRCSPRRVTPRRQPPWPSGGSAAGCTAPLVGHALLRGSLATAWRDGMERWPTARVGGGAGGEPLQPRSLPGAGPGRVHHHDGALDAGLLPRDDEPVPGPPRAATPAPSVFRRWSSAAGRATRTTRATSEALAGDPPEPAPGRAAVGRPREWIERGVGPVTMACSPRWPLLAPQLLEWKADVLG